MSKEQSLQSSDGRQLEIASSYFDSYGVCINWLKARSGRSISGEEIQHYEQLIVNLKDIAQLVEEVRITVQAERLKKLEIFERLRAIVVTKLGVEPEKVTPTASFTHDLGADSLDIMGLLITIQDTFNIELPDQAIQAVSTIQQTIHYISQKAETIS
jgi:acyl carrier protein